MHRVRMTDEATGSATARWEFRCWPSFDEAARQTARLDDAPGWTREVDEHRTDTYLLASDRPELLPKLRGGDRLEVKRRLEVRGTLERWEMALSEPLPLDRTGSDRAEALLGSPLPLGKGDHQALARSGWLVTPVTKARRRWKRDGTTVEVTRSNLGWTVAAEERNHGTLLAVVDGLGLSGLPNVDYGTRLHREAESGQDACKRGPDCAGQSPDDRVPGAWTERD